MQLVTVSPISDFDRSLGLWIIAPSLMMTSGMGYTCLVLGLKI
ncbi:MAG: hypothetical protein P8J25_02335 [Porticoccaceae bacterium]|nr:hypothetical protein [Porticoccaceae bacterium]